MIIPRRFETIAFSFVLSGLMSFIISGVSTFRATGLVENFLSLWGGAYLTSWLVAFPVVLVVAPAARKIVHSLLKKG